MFVHEPSLTHLTSSPDDILLLQVSLNRPMVALEDHPTDEGEATICSVRRESDMVSTYVYLCLRGNAMGMFYHYEADPYPEDLRDMVEGEALSFAESLGFIMDNTNFADLDAGERKHYLEGGPFQPGSTSSASTDEEEPAPVEVDEAAVSDDEIADAVRALIEEEPAVATEAALELPANADHEDEVDDADFERAVQEFIGDDEPAIEDAASESRAPLSRFQRKLSDAGIYAIRGMASGPGAAGISAAGEDQGEPSAETAAPALEKKSALPGDGDSRTRSRRARVRYLASF